MPRHGLVGNQVANLGVDGRRHFVRGGHNVIGEYVAEDNIHFGIGRRLNHVAGAEGLADDQRMPHVVAGGIPRLALNADDGGVLLGGGLGVCADSER